MKGTSCVFLCRYLYDYCTVWIPPMQVLVPIIIAWIGLWKKTIKEMFVFSPFRDRDIKPLLLWIEDKPWTTTSHKHLSHSPNTFHRMKWVVESSAYNLMFFPTNLSNKVSCLLHSLCVEVNSTCNILFGLYSEWKSSYVPVMSWNSLK